MSGRGGTCLYIPLPGLSFSSKTAAAAAGEIPGEKSSSKHPFLSGHESNPAFQWLGARICSRLGDDGGYCALWLHCLGLAGAADVWLRLPEKYGCSSVGRV